MKKFFKFIMGVVVTVVVLIVVGVGITAYTANKAVQSVDHTVKTIQNATQSKDQELADMLSKAPAPTETHDDYSYTAEYTLTNNTKDTFDYIQLNADVFDKNGTKLGNDMANITNVTPGQTFKVKLTFVEQGANSYKVTGISSTPK